MRTRKGIHGFQRKGLAPVSRIGTRDRIERRDTLRGPRRSTTPLNPNAVRVLLALRVDRWQGTVDIAQATNLRTTVVVPALRELRAADHAISRKVKPNQIGSPVEWKATVVD